MSSVRKWYEIIVELPINKRNEQKHMNVIQLLISNLQNVKRGIKFDQKSSLNLLFIFPHLHYIVTVYFIWAYDIKLFIIDFHVSRKRKTCQLNSTNLDLS